MKFAIVIAAAALATPVIAAATCQRKAVPYNEPAQRLDQSVQRVAHRSGCFVEVDLVHFGNRRTAALRGVVTPRDALARMVRPANLLVVNGARANGYRLVPSTLSAKRSPHINGQDDAAIQHHAAAIDRKIDEARAAGRLTQGRAAELHLKVGQVQTETGHAARTQAKLSAEQAADINAKLAGIDSLVPRR